MGKRKKKDNTIYCKDCKYITFEDMLVGLCDNPLSPFFGNRPVRPWDYCPYAKHRKESNQA